MFWRRYVGLLLVALLPAVFLAVISLIYLDISDWLQQSWGNLHGHGHSIPSEGFPPARPNPPIPPVPATPREAFRDNFALIITFGTFIVSTISAISTVWLAWRGDRRQSHEFELKIQQLQLQLQEARELKTLN
jgi:hypothetical protein